MDVELSIIKSPSESEINHIKNELKTYNDKIIGDDEHKPLNLIVKSGKDEIIGGLIGGTYWGWLYIDHFWIDEKFRNHGIGSEILKLAEKEAKERGCKKGHLYTHDFQAVKFYKRHGYKIKCKLKGLPKGYNKYLMVKKL